MKTPEDIISTLTVGGYREHGEYLYDAGEIKEAMKEYAKQWIDKAATIGRMYAGLNSANAIEDLKSKIDGQ